MQAATNCAQQERRRVHGSGKNPLFGVEPRAPPPGDRVCAIERLTEDVWVQIEAGELSKYGGSFHYARFHDMKTGQPFLGEGSVVDGDAGKFAEDVKADPEFMRHVEDTRRKLLPGMARYGELLQSFGISQRQLQFLQGVHGMTLETGEIEDMIERGYLTRELKLGAKDRAVVTAKLERQIAELHGLEASGKREEAARCRKKAQKRQRWLEATEMKVTLEGRRVREQFPARGVVW
jgi:hypothetical protein